MIFRKTRAAYDWLIVGLGNPGLQYEGTRHNIGFRAVDAFAERQGAVFGKRKFDAVLADCTCGDSRLLLMKPQTYMNLSGKAVSAAAGYYKIPPERILVLFDDISLDAGSIRIRRRGSAGGHNGVKDIIELLGSEDFPRIKLGVGAKPHPDYDLKAWVLGRFPPEQEERMAGAVQNAAAAAAEIVASGIDSAMNRYSK